MSNDIVIRVKTLRKALKLTQSEFGNRLSVGKDVIANIEGGRLQNLEQKEPLFRLMCKEFNVRYEWLINGEGEMFSESQEDFFDKLAEQYGLGVYARKILEFYGSLDNEQKNTLETFLYQAATIVLEDNIQKARTGVAEANANTQTPESALATNLAFDRAFSYRGIGNVADSEISAVDAALDKMIYRAAYSESHTEHEVIKDGNDTIDKLSKIPSVTSKDEF